MFRNAILVLPLRCRRLSWHRSPPIASAVAPLRPRGGEGEMGDASLHDDLPVHPGVRRADVEVGPRLVESDRLRLARAQHSSIPSPDFAAFEGSCGMWCVAGIGERQYRPRLHPDAGRGIDIFHIFVANLDL